MTRKTRRAVFYLLFCLFFIVGALVVLYAEGWRVDLKTFAPEKVGGIFVRSFPSNAAITLDGDPVQNQTGFLFAPGTLISNLYPKDHALALSADGYLPWSESVNVLPSLVTELKYAVLIPKANTRITTTSAAQFAIVSGEPIIETPYHAIMWRGRTIANGTIVDESANLKNLLMQTIASRAYWLYDFGTANSVNVSNAFTQSGIDPSRITHIAIDPYDVTKVVAMTPRRVAIFDATLGTTTVVVTPFTNTLGNSFAIAPSHIAWTKTIANAGAPEISSVVLYDPFSQLIQLASSTVPGVTVKLAWLKNNALAVEQDDGSLYIYDTSAAKFQKLADDVKDFVITDDGSALAALEHKSVEVFPFTDALTYRRFNLPDMGGVQDIFWYKDMSHLFVIYPDHVSFLDLADLGLRNFVKVSDGTSPVYKEDQNALYVIDSAQKVLRFDFPG